MKRIFFLFCGGMKKKPNHTFVWNQNRKAVSYQSVIRFFFFIPPRNKKKFSSFQKKNVHDQKGKNVLIPVFRSFQQN